MAPPPAATAPVTVPLTSPPKKTMKRPPTLQINAPQQPQQTSVKFRATTAVTEGPGLYGNRLHAGGGAQGGVGGTIGDTGGVRKRTLAVAKEGTNRSRSGSLQAPPDYTRGVSVGNDGGDVQGAQTYTPRSFKNGNSVLSYNRSNMKNPKSLSSTPSPMDDRPAQKQKLSDDSYMPKITEHTKSWPAFLARNYYHLNNTKLCLTFLINVMLLTYQVLCCDTQSALCIAFRVRMSF